MATTKAAGSAPAKKTSPALKANIELQFDNKSVSYDDIMKHAKSIWTDELKKTEALTTLELYIKPEESRVYFVANGKDEGSFEI